MTARTLRLLTLTLLLAALGRPLNALAQAPVVANNSIIMTADGVRNCLLYQATTWAGGYSWDSRLIYTNLTQPAHGVITFPGTYFGASGICW